jgi:glutamine amidotransferase
MIGVVDYGAGNLRSVANALERLGLDYLICRQPREVELADRLVLPGVGHFGSAASNLAASGLRDAIRRHALGGRPLLGICLGLQLLLESSEEAPAARGLELFGGTSTRLRTRRVPHMGWNLVRPRRRDDGSIPPSAPAHFYFAHGFAVRPDDDSLVVAHTCQDDRSIPAIVGRDRLWGVQFHPEKSGRAGLELMRRFASC